MQFKTEHVENKQIILSIKLSKILNLTFSNWHYYSFII